MKTYYSNSGQSPNLPLGYSVQKVKFQLWEVFCEGQRVGQAECRIWAVNLAQRHQNQKSA